MKIVEINDNLTEIDGCIRVEGHPPRRRAKATKDLLDNKVTASHYKVGRPDSLGKIIEQDKEMDYIDWKSKERVFSVYVLEDCKEKDKDGKNVVVSRFIKKGTYEKRDAALSEAATMASKLSSSKEGKDK